MGKRDTESRALRTGSFSIVQATYRAALLRVEGRGHGVPRFRGEVEARVQQDVLRIAGRFRRGFGWKDDRVKLPLKDIVHARVRSSFVDLWLRHADAKDLQRLTLELFTPDAAGEFVEWLPEATPWPEQDSAPATLGPNPNHGLMIAAAAGALVVVVLVGVLLFSRRM